MSTDNSEPLLLLYPRPNRRGPPIHLKESRSYIHGTSYHIITGEWKLYTEPYMKAGQRDAYEDDVDDNCIVQSVELVSSPVSSGLTFSYLAVPTVLTIPGGLYPGRTFTIKAAPLPNPARFNLNFLCGPSPFGDLGFQFDVRFNYLGYWNQVIRNHKIGNVWGTEEAYQTVFPFQLNTIFDMIIFVEEACFKVRINDSDYCVFNHRVQPVSCMDFLYIEGDVSIISLKIS